MGRDKRNEKRERFVALTHALLRSEAFAALSGNAKALCILMRDRAGVIGQHNGSFTLSVREAAAFIRAGKNAAGAALQELQAAGIAVAVRVGTIGAAGEGKATVWRFTALGTPADPRPSQDFLAWTPDAPREVARGRGARYIAKEAKNRSLSRERDSLSRERDVSALPCPAGETGEHKNGPKRPSCGDVSSSPCPAGETVKRYHGGSPSLASPPDIKPEWLYKPTMGARDDAKAMAAAAGVPIKGIIPAATERVRAVEWPADVKPGVRQDAFLRFVAELVDERAAAMKVVRFPREAKA